MDDRDEEIYRKHGPGLLRLTAMLVGPADAEDVFIEAFLNATASNRWAALDDDERRGYLYRTVVNQGRQWNRTLSRRSQRERFTAARNLAAEPERVPATEIWEAVASLPERARAVVFLTYWEDLDGSQVAAELGVSLRSVRRDLSDARERLGRLIDV